MTQEIDRLAPCCEETAHELEQGFEAMHERATKAEALLAELWADESVRAAVGEGDPAGLYARVEDLVGVRLRKR